MRKRRILRQTRPNPRHYRLSADIPDLIPILSVAFCDFFNPATLTLSARLYPSKPSVSRDLSVSPSFDQALARFMLNK